MTGVRLAALLLLVMLVACGDAKTELDSAPDCTPATTTTEIPQSDYEEGGRISRQQREVQPDMEVVTQYISEHPDDFADRKFDPFTDPESIVVGFVRSIDEHRAELSKRVAYPDRLRVIELPVSQQELQRMYAELSAEMGPEGESTYYSTGLGFGALTAELHADKEEVAAALHEKYGEAIKIRLGARPYPAAACIEDACRALAANKTMRGVEVRFKEPVTIDAGKDGEATLVFRNAGPESINVNTGGHPAAVVERGSTRVVARPFGARTAEASGGPLAPGQEIEIPAYFSTSNCTGEGDYALAPGTYGLLVEYGNPGETGIMRSEEGTLIVR